MLVYKYLAPERLDVLERKRIRFTQPDATNDPFELRPTIKRAIDLEDAWELLEEDLTDLHSKLEKAYSQMPRRKRRALSLEQFKKRALERGIENTVELLNDHIAEIQQGIRSAAGKRIGILSLSELPTSAPMWAYYAENYTGFLLEFDSSSSFFDQRRSEKDEFYRLRQVQYREELSIPKLFKATGDDLFVVKATEWDHEREWRMLAPLEHADEVLELENDTVYLFDLPPDCISGFVLGAQSTPELRDRLTELRNGPDYSHVRLGEIQVSDEEMELEIQWLEV